LSERAPSQLRVRATMPAIPPGFVHRPRLEQQLYDGTEYPVTLVCAGPGFGKSLLVASWLAHRSGPAAWLTLDETDNDLRTLWADILGALGLADAVSAANPLSELVPASAFGAVQIRQVRAGLAQLPAQTVLVLDDLDQVHDPVALGSVSSVLEHQDANLRLVLIARSDPPLRLHRVRIRGDFSEIRARDLAFRHDEAAELLKVNDVGVDDQQVEVLLDRTQGWPAGLRLAAMSLEGAEIDGAIARFTGTDRLVAAYLIGEVLDRQPPQIRNFLLRTSVVERVSGPLANRLTGRTDGTAVLESLVAGNALVVEFGDTGGWFGYHPLLRELLEHRFSVEHPEEYDRAQLAAAHWFADLRQPITAIQHAIAASAWGYLSRLIAGIAVPLAVSPEGAALATALEPATNLAGSEHRLCAALAGLLWHCQRHDFQAMRRDALDAATFLADEADDIRVPAEILIATTDTIHRRATADNRLPAAAEHLLWLIDAASPAVLPAGRQYRVIALSGLGVGQLTSGDLRRAERSLRAASDGAVELSMPLAQLSAESHLSVIDLIHGAIGQAQHRATSARSGADRKGWGYEPEAFLLYFTLGMTHVARNELDEAFDVLGIGLAATTSIQDTASRMLLGVAATSVAVARGDIDASRAAAERLATEFAEIDEPPELLARWCAVAQAWVQLQCGQADAVIDTIHAPKGDGFADALERLVLARAHLDVHEPGPAFEMLEPLTEPASPFRAAAVEALVLSAVAAERQHRDSAALRLLARAVDLAEPERILRPFLDVGAEGRALIARYRHVIAEHGEFTAQLATGPAKQERPVAGLVAEHLTERELIVLRYLPTMLKAGEIANDLFVSVNTVKSHLRAIYRKFDVTTRRAAVERAQDLNLL
jgi:LuxR family transcriptional regulator, maltose regulon positive regulatory protein